MRRQTSQNFSRFRDNARTDSEHAVVRKAELFQILG